MMTRMKARCVNKAEDFAQEPGLSAMDVHSAANPANEGLIDSMEWCEGYLYSHLGPPCGVATTQCAACSNRWKLFQVC